MAFFVPQEETLKTNVLCNCHVAIWIFKKYFFCDMFKKKILADYNLLALLLLQFRLGKKNMALYSLPLIFN